MGKYAEVAFFSYFLSIITSLHSLKSNLSVLSELKAKKKIEERTGHILYWLEYRFTIATHWIV